MNNRAQMVSKFTRICTLVPYSPAIISMPSCTKERFLGIPLYGIQIIKKQKTKITKNKCVSYITVRLKPQIRIFFIEDHLRKLCPNWPKLEFFGPLFNFELLNFFDFAYYSRQTWYLKDDSPAADSLVIFIGTKFYSFI